MTTKNLATMEKMVHQAQSVRNEDELDRFVNLLGFICYQNWEGSAEVDLNDDGSLNIRLYNEDGDMESECQATPTKTDGLYEFRPEGSLNTQSVLLPLVPSAIVGFMTL